MNYSLSSIKLVMLRYAWIIFPCALLCSCDRAKESDANVSNTFSVPSGRMIVFESKDGNHYIPPLPARYVSTDYGWLFLEDPQKPLESGSVVYNLPEDTERFSNEAHNRVSSSGSMALLGMLSNALGEYAAMGELIPLDTPPPKHDWVNLEVDRLPALEAIIAGITSNDAFEYYQEVARTRPDLGLWEHLRSWPIPDDLSPEMLEESYVARFNSGKFVVRPKPRDIPESESSDYEREGVTWEIIRVTWFKSDKYPDGAWSIWLWYGDPWRPYSFRITVLEPIEAGGKFIVPQEIVQRAISAQ